jgi:hypothetical protein
VEGPGEPINGNASGASGVADGIGFEVGPVGSIVFESGDRSASGGNGGKANGGGVVDRLTGQQADGGAVAQSARRSAARSAELPIVRTSFLVFSQRPT